MKNLLISLIFSFPLTLSAQYGGKNFIDQNYIEVTGKSEMHIAPDKIFITILLKELDSKNKVPLAELEKRMTDKLKQLGLDLSKDLLVKDISSNFKSSFLSKDAILLSKEYQLLVRDGNTAGKVFAELEKAGISNVSIEKLDHSQIIELRKQVKINAIKAAKEKAGLLASAVDQSIGRAIFIQELDLYNAISNDLQIRGSVSRAYDNVSQSAIDFEKIELNYSMLCRFELK